MWVYETAQHNNQQGAVKMKMSESQKIRREKEKKGEK
jgi:hypothetical protein